LRTSSSPGSSYASHTEIDAEGHIVEHSTQESRAPSHPSELPGGLTHREFKLLLDGSRFNERTSLHRIRKLVETLADERPNVTFYPTADLSCRVRVIELA
jgi:hypothetical protein